MKYLKFKTQALYINTTKHTSLVLGSILRPLGLWVVIHQKLEGARRYKACGGGTYCKLGSAWRDN